MKKATFNFFLNNYILYNKFGQICIKKSFITRYTIYYYKYLVKSL